MAKRYTDTAIWEKDWYLSLTPVEKSAWHYIAENCDPVGVWPCSFRKAEFCIGAEVDWAALMARSNGNIHEFEPGKWWLVDFVLFQYGELNPECRPHQSYIALLKKHGLYKEYLKGIHTLKEKDKEKDKEKEPEQEPEMFSGFWESYPRKVNRAGALKAWRAREHEKGFDAGEVTLALQNYKRQVAGKDPEYILHPATFLGPGLRWKDFLAPAKPVRKVVHKFCGACGKEYWGSACDCGWSE